MAILFIFGVNITLSGDENNRITIAGYPGERPIIDGEYTKPNKGTCTVSGDCPEGYSCDENYHVCGNGLCDPISGNCFIYDGLIKITGEYVTVDNLEIKRSFGRGIQVYGSAGNSEITNCWVHDNRAEGILIYIANPYHLIDNCKVYNNCNFATYSRSSSELDWPGALAWRTTEYVVVSHCEVYNNWGEGIIVMQSGNASIIGNEVYDNFAAEIYGDGASNILVDSNLVYNSGNETFFRNSNPCSGIWFDDEPGTCNSSGTRTNNIKVINNLLAGNGVNIIVDGGCAQDQSIESMIANNTSINPSLRSIDIVAHNGAIPQSTIVNNIWHQSSEMVLNIDDVDTIKFSNNIWSLSPTFPSNVIHPSDSGSLKLLMTGDSKLNYLNDIINIQSGEKMESNCFRILSNSPAINMATKLDDVTIDYFGTQRDQCPDTGAVEHTGY